MRLSTELPYLELVLYQASFGSYQTKEFKEISHFGLKASESWWKFKYIEKFTYYCAQFFHWIVSGGLFWLTRVKNLWFLVLQHSTEKHPKLIEDSVFLFYFSSLQNEASLVTWRIKTVIVTRTLKRYIVQSNVMSLTQCFQNKTATAKSSAAYSIIYHGYWL